MGGVPKGQSATVTTPSGLSLQVTVQDKSTAMKEGLKDEEGGVEVPAEAFEGVMSSNASDGCDRVDIKKMDWPTNIHGWAEKKGTKAAKSSDVDNGVTSLAVNGCGQPIAIKGLKTPVKFAMRLKDRKPQEKLKWWQKAKKKMTKKKKNPEMWSGNVQPAVKYWDEPTKGYLTEGVEIAGNEDGELSVTST